MGTLTELKGPISPSVTCSGDRWGAGGGRSGCTSVRRRLPLSSPWAASPRARVVAGPVFLGCPPGHTDTGLQPGPARPSEDLLPGIPPRAGGNGQPEPLPRCSRPRVCTAVPLRACVPTPLTLWPRRPCTQKTTTTAVPPSVPTVGRGWPGTSEAAGRPEASSPVAGSGHWEGHLGQVGQGQRLDEGGCGAGASLTSPREISVCSSLGGMVMTVVTTCDSGREGASAVRTGRAGRGRSA